MNIVYYFIKNNPKKLLGFYRKRELQEEKDAVIERLIEINAIDELWEIRKDRPDKIYPFLIDKLKKNKEKLVLLYQVENNDYKVRIIHHLIKCNAVNELWGIKDTNRDNIYPFLIKIYEKDVNKLILLYKRADFKHKIILIDCLKDLKAIDTLWNIKEEFPLVIYPYLIEIYREDEEKLFELYQTTKDEFKEDRLMKLALNNPIAFFSAKESSCSLDDFLSENKDFLLFIAEFPLMLKEVFRESYNRIKLYLLLSYYGASNIKLSPIAPYYNIGTDCYKEKIKKLSSNFDGFMNKALDGFEINDYILAYLVNNEAFKNKLNCIKKTKTIVVDYDKNISVIKNKYLQQKKNANSKQEIESLLKQESIEIDLVFDQKKFTILMSIINNNQKIFSSNSLPNPIVSQVESKNKVNLELITTAHKLTNNYLADRKKIDSELENIIINLNDANEIMKAKAHAKNEQNLLIDIKDFCSTLQAGDYQLANNDKIIKVLGEFLIHYQDLTVREAILHFACRSEKKIWLTYIEKIMAIDSTGQFIDFYLYFLSNNISSKSLKLLLELYRLNMYHNGKKPVKISESKSLESYNLDTIKIILLKNLIYLYYFANKDDLVALIEFKNSIGETFQPSQRDALTNLIDKIIEKAGKESKTISLNQEQRADSKDIFVNKD